MNSKWIVAKICIKLEETILDEIQFTRLQYVILMVDGEYKILIMVQKFIWYLR